MMQSASAFALPSSGHSLLGPLIEASVRGLQAPDYSPSQMDQALGTWLGLDTQLIADGPTSRSKRPITLTAQIPVAASWLAAAGPPQNALRQRSPPRSRRCFTGSPDRRRQNSRLLRASAWARRGIGTRILELCEQAARAEGFTRFEMGATLTGIRFTAATATLKASASICPWPTARCSPS